MGEARLRVKADRYDILRYEAVESGVFACGDEFDKFADGTLVSRVVSYRVQGLTYNPGHLLLDELECLLDQLAEIMDDHQRKRDQRVRKVNADQGGDGPVQGAEAAPQA